MTEVFKPLVDATTIDFDNPVEHGRIREQVEAKKLTHCKDTSERTWLLHPWLNKKSVPLNHAGNGPTRLPFRQVVALGVMSDNREETEALREQAADTQQETGHADRTHAVLSASGSHRWLNCPPSAQIEAQYPDTASEAAKEGTAAHELAEWKLRDALDMPDRGERPTSEYHDEDMEDYTDGYVAWILEQYKEAKAHTADATILIEQRLDFSRWVPNGFGTGDCLIITDSHIHVIDFKYGAGVIVDANENTQMGLYGLGAIDTFGDLYDLDMVSMTIYQPRSDNISSWAQHVDDLIQWADKTVAPTAELAAAGKGEFKAGSWCQFCKIANTCRARAEANLALAQHEFAKPAELSDKELAEIMAQIPDLKKWAGDVEKHMTQQAVEHGHHYDGFKIVEGRSIRKWTDEQAVAKAAESAGYPDVFDTKLIGITAMEKYMGKPTFREVLSDLVYKPAGKPVLVPESDRRKAIQVGAAAEFEEVQSA